MEKAIPEEMPSSCRWQFAQGLWCHAQLSAMDEDSSRSLLCAHPQPSFAPVYHLKPSSMYLPADRTDEVVPTQA